MGKSTWSRCPRCGSARVEDHGFCITLGIGLGMIGCSSIFFICVFLLPVGIIMAIVGGIITLCSPGAKNLKHCKECNYFFKPGEEKNDDF